MTRAAIAILLSLAAGVTMAARPQAGSICEGVVLKLRQQGDGNAGGGSAFSALTGGSSPAIQIAPPDTDGKDVSLDRSPAADTRIMFEKRFRAEFGESPALVRELRNWDALDVMTLPASSLHMVLSTTPTDLCESRIFFRTTTIRESERLPDPPAGPNRALCQSAGGFGYLARVNGIEAFLEYRLAQDRESFRIVPLVDNAWQPACTFEVPR